MAGTDDLTMARRVTVLFVWGVGIVLVLWFFQPIMHVLLLFLASATIAAALRPLTRWLPGKRWLKGSIVGTTFWLLIAGLLALMAWQLKAPIQEQIEQWPRFEENLNQSLQAVGQWFGASEPVTVQRVVAQAGQWVLGSEGGPTLAGLADGVSGVVLALLMLVFGSIFLLAMQPEELVAPIWARLPVHRVSAARDSLWSLEPKLRWWLLGTLFSMILNGGTTYLGLLFIGMEFALPLALITGVSQVVPTLGPAVATILALLLAATQGTDTFIAVAVLYTVVLTVESNVVTPLVMKQAVHVPPVVSLFTVLLWARLLGPLGLLLAIPINLVIWSVFLHFVPTRLEAATGSAAGASPGAAGTSPPASPAGD